MSVLQNLILNNDFFKSPNSSKSENFRSIGFDFESSKIMIMFLTIITVAFFSHWT